MGAEFFEGKFGVVASFGGLGDLGDAVCIETGEQDGGLYLGAGHRHFVVNGSEFAAVDFKRGEIIVLGADIGAHLAERGNDALHGALLQRSIAGNFGGELLSAEDSGEEPDGGAGIFGVEGAPAGFEAVEAVTRNFDGGAFDLDVGAERFHAAEGAVAIVGRGEIAEFAGATGERGDHGVAVGYGFVAGKLDTTREGLDGVDDLFFHDGVLMSV